MLYARPVPPGVIAPFPVLVLPPLPAAPDVAMLPMSQPKPAEAPKLGSGPTVPDTHSCFAAVMKQGEVDVLQSGAIVAGLLPMYVYA